MVVIVLFLSCVSLAVLLCTSKLLGWVATRVLHAPPLIRLKAGCFLEVGFVGFAAVVGYFAGYFDFASCSGSVGICTLHGLHLGEMGT